MIELLSVRLENFRSFTDATFVPAPSGEGLTAITGRNGAGKSSIIHALMWALYGETPNDVPVKGLRRQGSTEPVQVRVVFRHDGQTVTITRSLRGKNDTGAVNIEVDGVQQTTVSVRTAKQWVTDRLRLDSAAFLTAFVVRQKELDALLTDRPADRRKLVERLAGIERMRDALSAARAEANEYARAYEALPNPEGDPEVLKGAAAEAQRVAEEARGLAAVAAEAADEAEKAAKVAEDTAQKAREEDRRRRDGEARVELLESQIRSVVTDVDRLQRAASAAEGLPYAQAAAAEAEADLQDAEACEAAAIESRAAASRAAEVAGKSREKAAAAVAAAIAAAAVLEEAELELGRHVTVDQLEVEKRKVHSSKEELAGRVGEARAERVRLETAIAALSANTDPACPTCTQPLPDPGAVVAVLRDAAEGAVRRESDAAAELEAAGRVLVSLEEQVGAARVAAGAVEKAVERVAAAREVERAAAGEAQVLEGEAAGAEAAAVAAEVEAAEVVDGIGTLRANVQDTRRVLMEAEVAAAEAGLLPEKEAELHNLRGEVEALRAGLAVAAEATPLAQVESDRTAAWRLHNARRQALHEASSAALAAGHAAKDAVRAVEAAEAAAGRKAAALAAKEVSAGAAAALDEFRKDRLSRLAPELSEVASDFVSRMTEGKYVAVELDENFTPTLTDSDGNSRAASWLSGGEESAVALALRVAIGEVLSGNRGGLLVLDEVLTAQDSLRRAATMSAIRELPRQVVAINHVAEATDMADKVVDVVETPEGSVLN